jgi:hypothetical protein
MVDRDWIALAGFDDILSVDREPSKANLNIPPELGQQDLMPTTTKKEDVFVLLLSPKKLNDFGTMPGSRFYHQRLSRQLSQPKKRRKGSNCNGIEMAQPSGDQSQLRP